MKALKAEIKQAFAQLSDADREWFQDALEDPLRKWFVVQTLEYVQSVPEQLFQPLLRATIYEVDPDRNRDFLTPLLFAFGLRSVHTALLEVLQNGTDFEKTGAVNALLWTRVSGVFWGGSYVELDANRDDITARKNALLLSEFTNNPNVEVRRSIITQLDFDPNSYPDEFKPLVPKAIRIAKAHSDEYIRNTAETQLAASDVLKPLPYRSRAQKRW
jgi:hypothetical protein